MCLRFRSCPVVLDIELCVSARYNKTRVLLRARRLRLLLVAAASGGVRHNFGPIRTQENNDFSRPTTAKLLLLQELVFRGTHHRKHAEQRAPEHKHELDSARTRRRGAVKHEQEHESTVTSTRA